MVDIPNETVSLVDKIAYKRVLVSEAELVKTHSKEMYLHLRRSIRYEGS